MTTDAVPVCRFGDAPLTIEDVVALAQRQCEAALSDAPAFRAHIQRGADFLDRLLREDGVIYGVTTGYGDSCTVNIPPALVAELPHHLYTYHGCGLGRYLDPVETRAVLAARLASLVRGMSGVSVPLLEGLATLLQHDVLPMIPAEGSVGASGDLTPLSYVAAVLCGEREVLHDGRVQPAAEVLAKIGMTPLKLRPKEGLAIMNGTAVMTGLACLAWQRADYLARMATRLTAFNVLASDGNAHHFDETLFAAKPHPGQGRIAARLRCVGGRLSRRCGARDRTGRGGCGRRGLCGCGCGCGCRRAGNTGRCIARPFDDQPRFVALLDHLRPERRNRFGQVEHHPERAGYRLTGAHGRDHALGRWQLEVADRAGVREIHHQTVRAGQTQGLVATAAGQGDLRTGAGGTGLQTHLAHFTGPRQGARQTESDGGTDGGERFPHWHGSRFNHRPE